MGTITTTEMNGKPGPKDQWFTESFGRGGGAFMGRITPGGERLFYFRYMDTKGTRPFIPIGTFHPKAGQGGMTVAQAREAATRLADLYRTQKDLREYLEQQSRDAQVQATREALQREADLRKAELESARRLTVTALFERWRATELQPQVLADGTRSGRKDGGEYVAQQFGRYVFPAIGTTAAADLTRADLMAVLDAQKAEGKLRTANVLFSDLRQMLGFAVVREIIPHNPLEGVRRRSVGGKDAERDRVLADDELRSLLQALDGSNVHPRTACALRLILATGCRVGEAIGAVWADAGSLDTLRAVADEVGTKCGTVDVTARRWHLFDTKNQRPHTIHLSDYALTQFAKLAEMREEIDGAAVPWVFPDRSGSQPVCVKSMSKQVADRQRTADKRLTGRSKDTAALTLPGGDWTPHDLRRTAATIMARLGFSTDVIDECLNHKQQSKVARVYIRDRREADQARAFDALGVHLASLERGATEQVGNVIGLRAA